MATPVLCLIFFTFLIGSNYADAKRKKATTTADFIPESVLDYLTKFGYYTEGMQQNPLGGKVALREMQNFAGLEVTGVLDDETVALLATPRCGNKDDSGANRMTVRAKRYASSAYKWTKNRLKYWFINYCDDLTRSQTRSAIQRAFQLWADHSPLSFTEASSEAEADLTIKFATGEHGDGEYNKFDGEGGTLAHAFFPQNGQSHFDEDELYTVESYEGINLFIVAAHEFGHAFGLGHSNVQGALMYPWYQGYVPNYQLPEDDIQGIQHMYGKPDVSEEPAPDGNMPATSGGGDAPDTCTSDWDAVDMTSDNKVWAFKGKYIWRIRDSGPAAGFPRRITKIFKRAPSNIDAVVTSRKNQKTYIFKGSRYWRYTDYVLDSNFPRKIKNTGLPNAVTSAFVWGGNGRIHVFKDNNYWILDERNDRVRGDKKIVEDKWVGIPSSVSAAFQWRNGKTYFFRGEKYFRFDDDNLRKERGYPKSKAKYWMKCGAPPRLPEPIRLQPDNETEAAQGH